MCSNSGFIDEEEKATYGKKLAPETDAATESRVAGHEDMSGRSYVLYDDSTDIIDRTMLCTADVAISHQGDVLSLDVDDAMQDKVSGCYLSQHSISHLQLLPGGQLHTVPQMFQERAHAVTLDKNDGCLTALNVLPDEREEAVVLKFLTHHRLVCRFSIFALFDPSPRCGNNARQLLDPGF